MHRYVILLLLFFCETAIFSQSAVKNVIVRDIIGDAQYQTAGSKSWIPILAGLKIQEKNLIRLNSTDTIITLELPDTSLLRLIGIGSFYIDYVNNQKNNTVQHKFLLLAGRWFYSSSSTNKTRFIMNTDITTSVIENGSGGGYAYKGTNEFIIRTGRGLTSYRQEDALAMVLDERQFVSFNIYDGFEYPKLATKEKFTEYIVFIEDLEEPTNKLTFAETKTVLQNFIVTNHDDFEKTLSPKIKKGISISDLNLTDLKTLDYLSFKTNNEVLQIEYASSSIAAKEIEEQSKLVEAPKIANKSLLQGLDLSSFSISNKSSTGTTSKRKNKDMNSVSSSTTPKNLTRSKATASRKNIPSANKKGTTETDSQEIDEELDVESLLNSLSEKAKREQEKNRKKSTSQTTTKKPKGKLVTSSITNNLQSLNQEDEENISDDIEADDDNYDENDEELTEEERFQRENYRPGDEFYKDFDPNDPRFQFNRFQVESAQDLLESEFSKVLFDF